MLRTQQGAPMNWNVLPSPQMAPANSAQWRLGQSLSHAPAVCYNIGWPFST